MKTIILSLTPYKEKDAIVNAITEERCFSFLARGILNPKNKNATINNPLTIIDLELSDRQNLKYPVMSNTTILFSPLQIMDKLEKLITLQLLGEIINKCLSDEDKPKLYKTTLETIDFMQRQDDYWTAIFYFIAEMLVVAGYGFEVDHCLKCGSKKDIVNFSFSEGGFICRNCANGMFENEFSKEEMFYIRNIFKATSLKGLSIAEIEESSKLKIFRVLLTFIKDNLGVTLKSGHLLLE